MHDPVGSVMVDGRVLVIFRVNKASCTHDSTNIIALSRPLRESDCWASEMEFKDKERVMTPMIALTKRILENAIKPSLFFILNLIVIPVNW